MYIRYIHWVTKTTCTPMYILSSNVYRRSPKNVTQCISPMYIDAYIHWVLYIGLHLYTLGIYISMHIYTLGNIFSYIHWVYTLECIIYIGVFFLLWGFVDAGGTGSEKSRNAEVAPELISLSLLLLSCTVTAQIFTKK